MPPRLPKKADFPSNLTFTITPPPSNHPPTNVLILLHGLGDTQQPFANLAAQLNLPETACLTLQAPARLPFDLPGFHWGDDFVFDPAADGAMDPDPGFAKAVELLADKVIADGLVAKCGYAPRDIVMFGFGQGGIVALAVAAMKIRNREVSSSSSNSSGGGDTGNEVSSADTSVVPSFGGIVSIGGFLPSAAKMPTSNKPKYPTPVLLCKGNRGSAITEAGLRRLKDAFAALEVCEWKKKGDGMPANRDEMLPIMRFFARRLRSMRGVPEGAVEIS